MNSYSEFDYFPHFLFLVLSSLGDSVWDFPTKVIKYWKLQKDHGLLNRYLLYLISCSSIKLSFFYIYYNLNENQILLSQVKYSSSHLLCALPSELLSIYNLFYCLRSSINIIIQKFTSLWSICKLLPFFSCLYHYWKSERKNWYYLKLTFAVPY